MKSTRRRLAPAIALLAALAACDRVPDRVVAPPVALAALGDADALLQRMQAMNATLAGRGIGVEQIEFFTIGNGRPVARLHQTGVRFVPNDIRRLAQGGAITYLVDQSDGGTPNGLTNAQTEAAIDRALATWAASKPLGKVSLVKRSDTGDDPDVFDALVGFGAFGNAFLATITEAGFYPRAMFDAIGGPGGGGSIIALTVTFVFIDGNGNPTDIDGDNYADAAFSEVYYNNTFGDPANDRAAFPWAVNQTFPGIDVETIALHETGHALGLGHFGGPPLAVMNPSYGGLLQQPQATDLAGLHAIWSSWKP